MKKLPIIFALWLGILSPNLSAQSFVFDSIIPICEGQGIELAGPGGAPHIWDTGDTTQQLLVYPVTSTCYIVSYDSTNSLDIVNGDFELGKSGLTTFYADSIDGKVLSSGSYTIKTSLSGYSNSSEFVEVSDHTTGSGQMMYVNGKDGFDPEDDVYLQAVAVEKGKNYIYSAWLANIADDGANPAKLRFYIDSIPYGALTAEKNSDWKIFYELWTADTTGLITIGIRNEQFVEDGNDFAIDDIYFAEHIPGGNYARYCVQPKQDGCRIIYGDTLETTWYPEAQNSTFELDGSKCTDKHTKAISIDYTTSGSFALKTNSPDDLSDVILLDFEMVGDQGGEFIRIQLLNEFDIVVVDTVLTAGTDWDSYAIDLSSLRNESFSLSKVIWSVDTATSICIDQVELRLDENPLSVSITNEEEIETWMPNNTVKVEAYDELNIVKLQVYLDSVLIGTATETSSNDFIVDFRALSGDVKLIAKAENSIGQTAVDTLTINTEGNEMLIFPNPFSDQLHLSKSADEIKVYDFKGVLVAQVSSASSVSLSHLDKGIYLIRFDFDGQQYANKVVKK